ncbi:MAG: DUF4359 domain-containing protein [Rhodothermales bacterium]|nr:DUF4359 domain-containing protein [Rhodothermales bacterium]MBO6779093.1 DUF4359 domain-containing protein [Rhodothermales bacterium]
MKTTLRLIVVLGVAGFLYVTNPATPEFEAFIQQRVEERLREETGDRTLGRLLTDLGSDIVGSLAARVSERSDYGIFSVYTVDVGADGDPDEAWKFLGIAGQFVELSSPNAD